MEALPIYKLFDDTRWQLELLKLACPNETIYKDESKRGHLFETKDEELFAIGSFQRFYECKPLKKLKSDPVIEPLISYFEAHKPTVLNGLKQAILDEVARLFDVFTITDNLSKYQDYSLEYVFNTVLEKTKCYPSALSIQQARQSLATILSIRQIPEIGWSFDGFLDALVKQYQRLQKSHIPMALFIHLDGWEKQQAYLELWKKDFACWETVEIRKQEVNQAINEYLEFKNKWRRLNENQNPEYYNKVQKWIKDISEDINLNIKLNTSSTLSKITAADGYLGSTNDELFELWHAVINNPEGFHITFQEYVFALDLPILQHTFDDWDLMQAAFEMNLLFIGQKPGYDPIQLIKKEFPLGQTKSEQKARLQKMMSLRNEWHENPKKPLLPCPSGVIERALKRVLNEYFNLEQGKTTRQLMQTYFQNRNPDYKGFCANFFEYLLSRKGEGEALLNKDISFEEAIPLKIQTPIENNPSLPENGVLYKDKYFDLSPNQYIFLKAAHNLKIGEKIDHKISICLNKRQKNKIKDKIAERFNMDKEKIFIPRAHHLQESFKQEVRWSFRD